MSLLFTVLCTGLKSKVVEKRWKIHKFGGSSLADASCFRRVAGLVLNYDEPRIGVVVSAMGGMTDALIKLATLAEQGDQQFEAELNAIGERYSEAARGLLDGEHLVGVLDAWSHDAEDIIDVLQAIALVKSAPQRSRDVVAGFGEIWSARLLAALLAQISPERGGTWIDAREIVTVRETHLGPTVLWDKSQAKMDLALPPDFRGIAVITGFVAADEEGLQTTLGRNGSDHSASIFAALTKASELSIWTDVDGVMSADPNRVPEAQVIQQLTYNEAMELASAPRLFTRKRSDRLLTTIFRSSSATATGRSTREAGSKRSQFRPTKSRALPQSAAWRWSMSKVPA